MQQSRAQETPAQNAEAPERRRSRLPFPVWSLALATSAAVAVVAGVVLTDRLATTGVPGRDGGALHPGEGGAEQRFETDPDGKPMEYQPGRTSVTLVPTTTVINGSTVVTPSPSPIELPSIVVPDVVLPVPSPPAPTTTTTTARPGTTTATTTAKPTSTTATSR
ncbi:hypothetical protein NLX83_17670 [Allokutzneria sp. A3M-2-11 16]|uniref:hypothetical protein n=1 Tax=Allokutzneria sp. A3M-2-11 16 TaxID=2962043 RepID=UPI0020B8633D|nr:hypothetical protein [Allokutzneria sp. A3M-2-11 16]MCP3801092.1 hypothetical protein [Allokutzneria sp. A3M-2-11 16]